MAAAVTIRDIAARAGVAVSTVSRALSDPDRVNDATRERIEEIARELGYRARRTSRARETPQVRAVALLVPDITNLYYFDLIRATQVQLHAAGYIQLLIDTESSGEVEAETIERISSAAQGFILGASRLSDDALGELAATVPLVIINRTPPHAPSVHIDSPGGYEQIMEHLFSLGHRNVAYVGASGSWLSHQRWSAIERKAAELDVTVVEVNGFAPLFESGPAAADAFLRTRATACLASNDMLAIGILERFAERGIRVPEDVSVVGCDDTFVATISHPSLTTLTSPIEKAGRIATSMLLSLLNPATRRGLRDDVVLPTHLTIRGSTGPAPA